MPKRFDTRLQDQLAAQRGDFAAIAAQAGVSHSWLSKFVNGHIPNPGIRTLEKLDSVLHRTKAKPAAQGVTHV